MYSVLGTHTYQVSIESIQTISAEGQSRTVVTGWAVDKLRKRALDLSLEKDVAGRIQLLRSGRPDLEPVFGIDTHEQTGFKIMLPAGMNAFTLFCDTPGKRIPKRIDIKRVHTKLQMEYYSIRFRQMSTYV